MFVRGESKFIYIGYDKKVACTKCFTELLISKCTKKDEIRTWQCHGLGDITLQSKGKVHFFRRRICFRNMRLLCTKITSARDYCCKSVELATQQNQ